MAPPSMGVFGAAADGVDPFLQTDADGRAMGSTPLLRGAVVQAEQAAAVASSSSSTAVAPLPPPDPELRTSSLPPSLTAAPERLAQVEASMARFVAASERLQRTQPPGLSFSPRGPTLSSSVSRSPAGFGGVANLWESQLQPSDGEEESATHGTRGLDRRAIWGLPGRGGDGGEYAALPTEDVEELLVEASPTAQAAEDLLDESLDACGRCRKSVKVLLEDPSSSVLASLVQYGMIALIFFSVSVAIIETEPSQRDNVVFKICEPIFTVLFTLEITLRFWTCDSTRVFFSSAFNVIDVLATLPCYTDLLIMPSGHGAGAVRHISDSFQALRLAGLVRVARLFRLLRILRVANTMRQSEMIMVVIRSVYGSLGGIWVLLTFMFVGLILSATIEYCCEMSDPTSGFVSIPVSIWWAATTITAVGYGDTLPKTVAGRIVAVATMFLGLVIMAICIAVVTNSFTIQFQRELYSSKIRGMQRRLQAKQRREAVASGSGGTSPNKAFATETPTAVSPRRPSKSRLFDEVQIAAAMYNLQTRQELAKEAPSGCGRAAPQFLERDFAAMVNQLEDMAEALLLGMEALIDEGTGSPSPVRFMGGASSFRDGSPLSRAALPQPETRCARMTLEMLRGNNRLWFEQARVLSEELLRMSDYEVPMAATLSTF